MNVASISDALEMRLMRVGAPGLAESDLLQRAAHMSFTHFRRNPSLRFFLAVVPGGVVLTICHAKQVV